MYDDETTVEDIETVQVTVDSLLRVLAGMSGDSTTYVFVSTPPHEPETELFEVFSEQEDASQFPVIDPERLIDRSGHEPILVDSTTIVDVVDGKIIKHDVDVELVRENNDGRYFTGDHQ